jgi:hypothetical protein
MLSLSGLEFSGAARPLLLGGTAYWLPTPLATTALLQGVTLKIAMGYCNTRGNLKEDVWGRAVNTAARVMTHHRSEPAQPGQHKLDM